jgi:[acyl-carrier-protein] S-malonyltransferase
MATVNTVKGMVIVTMKTGIVFPGQGSQIANLGQDFYKEFPQVRDLYERASVILGYDLLKACENQQGELNDTLVVQPALLVHSVACWHVLQQMAQIPIEVMSGHSLGELSAVVCAGGLDFEQTVALVKLRAELMSSCTQDGGMMVVFALPQAPITQVCNEISRNGYVVAIANQNSAEQWVLSGHRKALQAAESRLTDLGGVVKPLNISIPAHSILMQPVQAEFAEAIKQAGPQDCRIPIISCISGRVYSRATELPEMLSRQLTGCVNWPLTVSHILKQGVDTLIELGPKTILRDLTRLEFPNICAISFGSLENKNSLQRLLDAESRREQAARQGLRTRQTEGFLLACLRIAIGTPTLKNHTEASFLQTIRNPYNSIIEALDHMRVHSNEENTHDQINREVVRSAARCLLGILRAKGIDLKHGISLLDQAATSHSVQDTIVEYLV